MNLGKLPASLSLSLRICEWETMSDSGQFRIILSLHAVGCQLFLRAPKHLIPKYSPHTSSLGSTSYVKLAACSQMPRTHPQDQQPTQSYGLHFPNSSGCLLSNPKIIALVLTFSISSSNGREYLLRSVSLVESDLHTSLKALLDPWMEQALMSESI